MRKGYGVEKCTQGHTLPLRILGNVAQRELTDALMAVVFLNTGISCLATAIVMFSFRIVQVMGGGS